MTAIPWARLQGILTTGHVKTAANDAQSHWSSALQHPAALPALGAGLGALGYGMLGDDDEDEDGEPRNSFLQRALTGALVGGGIGAMPALYNHFTTPAQPTNAQLAQEMTPYMRKMEINTRPAELPSRVGMQVLMNHFPGIAIPARLATAGLGALRYQAMNSQLNESQKRLNKQREANTSEWEQLRSNAQPPQKVQSDPAQNSNNVAQ